MCLIQVLLLLTIYSPSLYVCPRIFFLNTVLHVLLWIPLVSNVKCLGPNCLRFMASQFKDIVTHTQKYRTTKYIFYGLWVQKFLWNFTGALWNFTQNFEPTHRKYTFYDMLKNWRPVIAWSYDILSLSETDPCNPCAVWCIAMVHHFETELKMPVGLRFRYNENCPFPFRKYIITLDTQLISIWFILSHFTLSKYSYPYSPKTCRGTSHPQLAHWQFYLWPIYLRKCLPISALLEIVLFIHPSLRQFYWDVFH